MRILGPEKAATAEDIQHLPLIRGLVKETLRYTQIDFRRNVGFNMPTWQRFFFFLSPVLLLSICLSNNLAW